MNGTLWRNRSVALVAIFTLLRLFFMGRTGLGDSESYYWTWSRHLDLSYYDHPPMVAWLISAFTWIGGDTAFCVRLPSAVLFTLVCWLIYKTSVAVFKDQEIAFWGLVLFNVSPLYSFGALQMVPDIPAALCWMLFVYLVITILTENRPRLWYAAGAVIGLGLLGKYMLLPLIPSTLLMLGYHPEYRKHLRQPYLYLGGLLGLFIFMPVLIWNYGWDFPSFKFHLVDRQQERHFSPDHMGLFLGGQALYMSPLAWLGFLYVAGRGSIALFREKNREFIPIFWMGVPPLAFFYFIGLWSRDSEPHWAAFGYLTLIIAWGAFYARNKASWRNYTYASIAVSGTMIALVYIHTFFPFLPIKPKYDITNEVYGWDLAGKAIEEEYANLQGKNGKFIMGNRWVICSQIEFATKHKYPVYCVNHRRDQFKFFPKTVPPPNADFIYVADTRFTEPPENIYYCDTSTKIRNVPIFRGGIMAREFHLYRVTGFKGLKP